MSYDQDVDAALGKIVITPGGSISSSDIARLKRIDPEVIVVKSPEEFFRANRSGDSPPHWGGAFSWADVARSAARRGPAGPMGG